MYRELALASVDFLKLGLRRRKRKGTKGRNVLCTSKSARQSSTGEAQKVLRLAPRVLETRILATYDVEGGKEKRKKKR